MKTTGHVTTLCLSWLVAGLPLVSGGNKASFSLGYRVLLWRDADKLRECLIAGRTSLSLVECATVSVRSPVKCNSNMGAKVNSVWQEQGSCVLWPKGKGSVVGLTNDWAVGGLHLNTIDSSIVGFYSNEGNSIFEPLTQCQPKKNKKTTVGFNYKVCRKYRPTSYNLLDFHTKILPVGKSTSLVRWQLCSKLAGDWVGITFGRHNFPSCSTIKWDLDGCGFEVQLLLSVIERLLGIRCRLVIHRKNGFNFIELEKDVTCKRVVKLQRQWNTLQRSVCSVIALRSTPSHFLHRLWYPKLCVTTPREEMPFPLFKQSFIISTFIVIYNQSNHSLF